MGEVPNDGKDLSFPEKTYISSKIVRAVPMDKSSFMRMKHHLDVSAAESEEGYMVRYQDGYVSWCPKAQFESTHREITEAEKMLLMQGTGE